MTLPTTHPGPGSIELGATFGSYRLSVPVGEETGNGTVYAATALTPERLPDSPPWLPLALKVFPNLPSEPGRVRGFVETARLQSTLHHANIVSIYEVGTSPSPFLSMTLVRGLNLAELVASARLDDTAALEVARCVGAALEAGHEHGLVYRNLKPSGVLLPAGEARRAMLGDFGAGRPADVEADVASNVRALGAILFDCLTCHSAEETSGALRDFRPDLPPALEEVLLNALDEDPSQRPGTPLELLDAVEHVFPYRRRGRHFWPTERLRPAAANLSAVPTPAVELPPVEPASPERASEAAAATAEQAATAEHTSTEEQTAPAPQPRKRLSERLAGRPADGEARTGRGWLRLPLAVALAVVAAALLGAVAAPRGNGPEAELASAGGLTLRHPANWVTTSAPRLPGLELRNPIALAPPDGEGSRTALIAGWLPATGHGSLPAGFANRLESQPQREPIELGSVQAFRYTGVHDSGLQRDVTLYLVPTDADSAVVACVAPLRSDGFMQDCERIASTLQLKDRRPVSIAPRPAYAAGLRRLLSQLNPDRRAARGQLRSARTRSGQAAAAARLSRVYARASRAADRLQPPPGALESGTGIERSTAAAARAYHRMATAASSPSGRGWGPGRKQAAAAERSLQSSFTSLQGLGYPAG